MDLLPVQAAACKSCGMCGAASRQSAVGSRTQEASLRLSFPVRSLILLAIGLYGVPLAGLLAGALIAAAFGANDFGALAGSLAGCGIAVFVMKQSAGFLEKRALERLTFRAAGSLETP
jgi:positive regulator of sigma E activity